MTIPTEGKLLRIFVGEADHWHGRPLYESIVVEARKRGLAGATVLKGFMGFGAHSRIHTAKVLRLSEDLPIIIEIADRRDQIEAFLPSLDSIEAFSVVPKDSLETGVDKPNAFPAGTGPFKFVSWQPRQELVFDRSRQNSDIVLIDLPKK